MILEYEREPIVGEPFAVTARGFEGTARMRLFIGQRLLAEVECPDPPCHEVVLIPEGTKGRMLRVIATDQEGQEEELELTIRESGGRTLTAGM
jgi:hypothetical protein